MVRGKSLASDSGKGPHSGHPGPPCLRVRAAPARGDPRVPAPALSGARQCPRRRASRLPAVRETGVCWTPPGPWAGRGAATASDPDSDPSQLRPGRAPLLSPLRRGEGLKQDYRARLGPASFGVLPAPLFFN